MYYNEHDSTPKSLAQHSLQYIMHYLSDIHRFILICFVHYSTLW